LQQDQGLPSPTHDSIRPGATATTRITQRTPLFLSSSKQLSENTKSSHHLVCDFFHKRSLLQSVNQNPTENQIQHTQFRIQEWNLRLGPMQIAKFFLVSNPSSSCSPAARNAFSNLKELLT
jgi:hypothetical protein